ncbi:MAG: FAD-binding oxidoreductase [Candidatus Omnitrophota bacterium]|nr:FAD-binding oxidoreductase [Candidatus Omnitrophota bacterium]
MPPTQFRTIVERIDSLAYNVRGFRLKLLEPSQVEFRAGQFIILHVPRNGGVVKRAYSIASPPHERQAIELCIQHVEGGIASTYFWGLKEGASVVVSGPHGNFLLKEPLEYDPVFMATGTGVAPLRSMIKDLVHRRFTRDVWLLFGTRYEHALLYESEFRSLTSLRHNFHYIPTVSRPKNWQGDAGHIQQTFAKYITDASNKEIYLCGWLEVVKAIYQDLASAGVPQEKLHYEEWA